METTKEEILQKHLNEIPHFSKSPDMFTRFLIYNAMEEYAKHYFNKYSTPKPSTKEPDNDK